MSVREEECKVCQTKAFISIDLKKQLEFVECPVCGRYQISMHDEVAKFNKNHLASYLIYHKYAVNIPGEYRYNTILEKEECDKYKEEFTSGNTSNGFPVHMDPEIVEAWYPRSFSERLDMMLLFFESRCKHIGQKVTYSMQDLISALFVDRVEIDVKKFAMKKDGSGWRSIEEVEDELEYMLSYLKDSNLVNIQDGSSEDDYIELAITPEGYKRVDELQKNSSYGRSVLVAMQFRGDTKALRESIKKGIEDAGYVPILIDEVQHNEFITPELLKHIRDSKFVVVDLTHMNNGAYFEEGYAMGLGKPVIQLCKKGVDLHFDIAQKNTIMWEKEDDIPLMLSNRIRATID